MNIGLFGLSGTGKSNLSSLICKKDKGYICTSASKIIKDYGYRIQYQELAHDVVEDNQIALVRGFHNFQAKHQEKDILLDLHNVIESPEGNIEISDNVFSELNLDAACFIESSPNVILKRRLNDRSRVRHISSIEAIARLQTASRQRFEGYFSQLEVPYLLLNRDHLEGLRTFLASLH